MRSFHAFVFCVLAAGELEAGPWGRDKGSLYLNLSYEFLSTRKLATPDGVVQAVPRFRLRQTGVYAAYGLTDRLSVIVDRLGFRTASLAQFDSASGIEDLRVGAQWELSRTGPWIVAARGIVQAPLGDESKGLGLLPTGSGAWESDLRASVGWSSSSGRAYAYGEMGYQARARGLRDAFIYEAQCGVVVYRGVWVQLNLRGLEPFATEPSDAAFTSPSGLGDGVTYASFGPSVILELGDRWGLQFDYEDAFRSKNLAVGPKFRFKFFVTS